MKPGSQFDAYLAQFKERYPNHVTIRDYVTKMRAGKIPRPEKINCGASWVDVVKAPRDRTFGFKTVEEAAVFRATYKD